MPFPRLLRRIAAPTLLAAALMAPSAQAAPELGLNLHGGGAAGTAENMQLLSETGSKWGRQFMYWNDQSAGTLAAYERSAAAQQARGIKTLLVITGTTPPPPGAFEAFLRDAVPKLPSVDAYEVWNEWDGAEFWHGGDIPTYARLLSSSYDTIKQASGGQATVLMGPTVGNNYRAIQQVIDNGARDKFDGVAVHTDTACLDKGPAGSLYREADGRISQFSFLGYKEVRETLLANGLDKPIWMSEFGWSATTATCARGRWAGSKPAGVGEENQAKYLTQAVGCMNEHPGIAVAMWFNNRDPRKSDAELDNYGLLRFDGSPRPALDAFKAAARNPAGVSNAQPCGDFKAPDIQVTRPLVAERYFGSLIIRATSPDGDVLRMSFYANGQEIRNFTRKVNGVPAPLDFAAAAPEIDWQAAKQLPAGTHTIRIEAKDAAGNVGVKEVQVEHVADASQVTRVPTKFEPTSRLGGKGKKRTLAGSISGSGGKVNGKVAVVWEAKRKGKWKKIHGGLASASQPLKFTQKLKYAGSWRVRMQWGLAKPYKSAYTCWLTFSTKSSKVRQSCPKGAQRVARKR